MSSTAIQNRLKEIAQQRAQMTGEGLNLKKMAKKVANKIESKAESELKKKVKQLTEKSKVDYMKKFHELAAMSILDNFGEEIEDQSELDMMIQRAYNFYKGHAGAQPATKIDKAIYDLALEDDFESFVASINTGSGKFGKMLKKGIKKVAKKALKEVKKSGIIGTTLSTINPAAGRVAQSLGYGAYGGAYHNDKYLKKHPTVTSDRGPSTYNLYVKAYYSSVHDQMKQNYPGVAGKEINKKTMEYLGQVWAELKQKAMEEGSADIQERAYEMSPEYF